MDKIETSLITGDSFTHNIDDDPNIPLSIFDSGTHPSEIKCHNEFNDQFEIIEESEPESESESELQLFNDDDSDDLLLERAMSIGKKKSETEVIKKNKPKIIQKFNPKIMNLSNLINTWKNERCTWDEYFSCIALLISSRSPSERLKVGSVIVKDNRIISAGYNGFPSGVPHVSIMRDNHEQNTIHAEQNAIADAARRGVSIQDSTIYVTHRPCINCAKFIISSGIKNIKYLSDYRNDDLVAQLLNASNISIEKL